MGLLTQGKPLSFEESKRHLQYVREHGIRQFLLTWARVQHLSQDLLKWGDEIECGVFRVDAAAKTIKLSLRSGQLLETLKEKEMDARYETEGCSWHPEWGCWMIESTPSSPYSNYVTDLLRVERNMTLRRRRILSVLADNEIAPTVSSFPLMGVGNFFHPALEGDIQVPYSQSSFVSDKIINEHVRFSTLVQNIRTRRTSKVKIQVPLFHDLKTPEFLRQATAVEGGRLPLDTEEVDSTGYKLEPDLNINMDAMAFGMGMCCLQVTFQARDVDESRYMYDQLAVLAPIMLAMTAATPIFKGRLADVDARWDVIAQSVDDRTPAERGEVEYENLASVAQAELAGGGVRRLFKSRYDSVSTFIYRCKRSATCQSTVDAYNDIPCPVDEDVESRLVASGIDQTLARHIAHLYTRDPLVIFEDLLDLDDETSMDHFENIQSTNWQTCRWKPPPPTSTSPDSPHIGWRTEFRYTNKIDFFDSS